MLMTDAMSIVKVRFNVQNVFVSHLLQSIYCTEGVFCEAVREDQRLLKMVAIRLQTNLNELCVDSLVENAECEVFTQTLLVERNVSRFTVEMYLNRKQ